MQTWMIGYACWIVLASVASFGLYAIDKWRASRGQSHRRIPERTLHLIDGLGGWPGGWLARRRFRHKTAKLSFRVVFWIVAIANVIATVIAAWCVAVVAS